MLISCNNSELKEREQLIETYLHKKLIIPDTLDIRIWGEKCEENIFSKPYKIATYLNGDCSSCVEGLLAWNSFIESNKEVLDKFSILFYVHSRNYPQLEYLTEQIGFKQPLIYDIQNYYYNLNNLPENYHFQTFLIDRNNKVLVVGNPSHNQKIAKIYIETIKGNPYN